MRAPTGDTRGERDQLGDGLGDDRRSVVDSVEASGR
jgi:hypothetical protein